MSDGQVFVFLISMPEIPDLEAFSRNLTRQLKGAIVEKLVVHKRARLIPSASAIRKELAGKKLLSVHREGKQLHFSFAGKLVLGVHLMLHGEFRWESAPKPSYLLAEFHFTNKPTLWITDIHRQATITLRPDKSEVPDVMDKKLGFSFWKSFLAVDARVKNHLRNQDLLRGMGNAYTDEILYDARISPFSTSSAIPDAKIRALIRSIRKVYTNAGKQIEKHNPDIIGGEYRAFLKVHNSKRTQSPAGFPVRSAVISGSKTYYTDEQILYK